MCQPRCVPPVVLHGPTLSRLAVFLALVLGIVHSVRAAEPRAVNPVAELRQTLKAPVFDGPTGALNLVPRQNSLQHCLAVLCRAPELREALLLQEWRSEDADERIATVDRAARAAVAQRFEQVVGDLLRQGDTADRLAAANMLAETAPVVRGVRIPGWTMRGFTAILAEQARVNNLAVQQAAARALGQINAEPALAVPVLAGLAQSGEPILRRAAVQGLADLMRTAAQGWRGHQGTPGETSRLEVLQLGRYVVPAAAIGLSDADPEVRRLSIASIRQTVAALRVLIADPPALALGRFQTPEDQRATEREKECVAALTEALKEQVGSLGGALRDPEAAVRLLAHQTLEEMAGVWGRLQEREESRAASGKAGAVAMAALRDQRQGPDQPLLQGLHAALPELAAGVNDPDVQVRRAVIGALETMGKAAEPAAPALIRALTDPDLFVRWAAARTLGRLGPVRDGIAVPSLRHLLDDPDLDVRLAAAEALKRYGPAAQGALPTLMDVVRLGNGDTRLAALEVLETIGPAAETAIPAIAAALRSRDTRLRKTATRLLGRFGPRALEAREALRQALLDDDPEVRKAASDALLDIAPLPMKPVPPASVTEATPSPHPEEPVIWRAANFAPAVSLRAPVPTSQPAPRAWTHTPETPRLLSSSAAASAIPLAAGTSPQALPPTIWQPAAPIPIATSGSAPGRPAPVTLRRPIPVQPPTARVSENHGL